MRAWLPFSFWTAIIGAFLLWITWPLWWFGLPLWITFVLVAYFRGRLEQELR